MFQREREMFQRSACTTMRIVSSHRSRATGTTVDIVDNRDGSFDVDDDNGWFTVCADHGGVISHPTLRLAREWAPHPDEWCPGCSTDDGLEQHT